MLTFWQSCILGVVEGFTEFLPISSTAHLVLVSDFLNIAKTDYLKTFEIAIQSGAILAVVVLYWRRFLDFQVVKNIVIAFLPTGVLGFALYPFIKTYLLGSTGVVLWALALGGFFLIIFEKLSYKKNAVDDVRDIGIKKLLGIGLFQAVAMIPGVSRAAATIVGGMIFGVRRATIVEFSFLLAVPTMLAATGMDLVKSAGEFSLSQFYILTVGFIVSFITAMISIKWLLNYVKGHTFTAFGIYRVVLVGAILIISCLRF